MLRNRLPLLFFLFLMSASCEKDNDFSIIPYLEYRGHEFKIKDEQRFIEVELYFNDRDGNIGLEPGDTFPPFNPGSIYYNNLWVTGYLIRDGETADTITGFGGRIPDLTPQGQNKSLEGTIYYDMFVEGFASGDSVEYEFILVDRDTNRSEPARSPRIKIEI
ncbi:MAG: hypothetical protein JJU02_16450 [Cryomorphaceae bacterium]|nr:hypothetical protein [Cryomorphaceae bacterium]